MVAHEGSDLQLLGSTSLLQLEGDTVDDGGRGVLVYLELHFNLLHAEAEGRDELELTAVVLPLHFKDPIAADGLLEVVAEPSDVTRLARLVLHELEATVQMCRGIIPRGNLKE